MPATLVEAHSASWNFSNRETIIQVTVLFRRLRSVANYPVSSDSVSSSHTAATGGSTSRNLGESDFADPAASVSLLRFEKSKTADDAGRPRSDTESAGRYSRTEIDGAEQKGKPRFNLTRLFRRNKDKVSGTDTDTMRTVVTVDDEKVQTAEHQNGQEGRTNPTTVEGGIVYAELDLQQQGVAPRRLNDEKTEYAEILYTKPDGEEEQTAEK